MTKAGRACRITIAWRLSAMGLFIFSNPMHGGCHLVFWYKIVFWLLIFYLFLLTYSSGVATSGWLSACRWYISWFCPAIELGLTRACALGHLMCLLDLFLPPSIHIICSCVFSVVWPLGRLTRCIFTGGRHSGGVDVFIFFSLFLLWRPTSGKKKETWVMGPG